MDTPVSTGLAHKVARLLQWQDGVATRKRETELHRQQETRAARIKRRKNKRKNK